MSFCSFKRIIAIRLEAIFSLTHRVETRNSVDAEPSREARPVSPCAKFNIRSLHFQQVQNKLSVPLASAPFTAHDLNEFRFSKCFRFSALSFSPFSRHCNKFHLISHHIHFLRWRALRCAPGARALQTTGARLSAASGAPVAPSL